jgi:hypothetical protein
MQEIALHVDETGINVDGKRRWLHNASSEKWTLFYPHEKRGKIAMDEMGVLPNFKGTLFTITGNPIIVMRVRTRCVMRIICAS